MTTRTSDDHDEPTRDDVELVAYSKETTFVVPPMHGRAKGLQLTRVDPDGTVHVKVGNNATTVHAHVLVAAVCDAFGLEGGARA